MSLAHDSVEDGNQHDEENDDTDDENLFCTLAVTGTNPTFQGIFICNEADSPDGQALSPMCVCQACAEVCFDDGYHEVEYIGMGPSYCDCSNMGNCKLHEKSLQEAQRLGIVLPEEKEESNANASLPEDFVREAFDVPMLQSFDSDNPQSSLSSLLVEQAQELIKHTKETHWIDESVVNMQCEDDVQDHQQLCLLESLAWSIYRSHRERYNDAMFSDDDTKSSKGGAEWWVQVKGISSSKEFNTNTADENDTVDEKNTPQSSSIDLHYDKDEALAESFGIGSFPVLSTVTYLTAAPEIAAPTVIFDHTYTQGEDEVMSSMMVSRPRIGKHICFDGRLLHGAPYHPSLLSSPQSKTNDEPDQKGSDEASPKEPFFRVTFLVNIWKDRRPASVHVLDDEIREQIISLPQPEHSEQVSLETIALPMTRLTIRSVSFEEEENIPEHLRERIELPFVSNLAEDDDDENSNQESSMEVVTFPPPPIEDCALLSFGPGLQAYMDYKYNEGEDEEDIESNAGQSDNESPSPSAKHKAQSDYV